MARITKALLTRGEGAKLPKSKIARPETTVYVKSVKEEINARPLFDGYTKGHGIIATHELRCLETAEGEKDKEKVESDEEVVAASEKKFSKTIITPIAIPGLGASYTPYNGDAEPHAKGKQSLPWLLRSSSNLGAQSDDIRAKKPAPAFIQNVKKLLRSHDEVIADKLSQ